LNPQKRCTKRRQRPYSIRKPSARRWLKPFKRRCSYQAKNWDDVIRG
jgi:hypothetical protein